LRILPRLGGNRERSDRHRLNRRGRRGFDRAQPPTRGFDGLNRRRLPRLGGIRERSVRHGLNCRGRRGFDRLNRRRGVSVDDAAREGNPLADSTEARRE
jgi:hypothetical protein